MATNTAAKKTTAQPTKAKSTQTARSTKGKASDKPKQDAKPAATAKPKTKQPEPITDVRAERAQSGAWHDHLSQRNGTEALQGGYVNVVSGEYAGRYGYFDQIATVDSDGYPKTIIVVSIDDRHERLEIDYSDCERTQGRGR